MRHRLLLCALPAALVIGAACTTEPVVTTVSVSPSAVSLDAIGDTAQLSATLTDQNGQPVVDQSPTWSTDDAQVAKVSSSGVVTAVANGTTDVTASAASASDKATVTVLQVVDEVAAVRGDSQMGEVGTTLDSSLVVLVSDRLDQPVAGESVSFAVTAGGGSVGSAQVSTGADGQASTTWTLGTVAGDPQIVTATVASKSATFSATAVAGSPDSLVKVSGDSQIGASSTALAESLLVRVADRYGNAVVGVAVTFSVTSGGGTVSPTSSATGSAGTAATEWTLGSSAGTQTAQAVVSGVKTGSPAVFTAEATTGTVAVNDGDGQTGLVGFAVNVPPSVIVKDNSNNPLQGITVTFAVQSGGGSVTGAVQVTGSGGVAEADSWILGGAPGINTLSATVNGVGFVGSPVTFTATGINSQYDIEVRFLTTPSAAQRAAFDSAEAKWERLIIGELADVLMNVSAGQCGSNSPAMNETVDDLVIFVTLEPIDGVGNLLGSAGPCYIRNPGNLPIVGRMRFDTDDLANLEANGQLDEVILHEMGHVLGFGSLWETFGYLKNPSLPDPGGEDTHFDGPRAIEAFDEMGGTSYTGGAKVPVENTQGGVGTRDAHWRESVFAHELMTGFLDPGVNPLSRLSVASMWDLAYTVNLAGSDSYTQTFTAPPARRGTPIPFGDDVIRGPIRVVDSSGRVIRVIEQ